jgi:3-hydroxy-3-methylglutaryl CoA synthase
MAVEAVKRILKKYKDEIEKSNEVIITSEKYYDSETGVIRRKISIDYIVGYCKKEKKDERRASDYTI